MDQFCYTPDECDPDPVSFPAGAVSKPQAGARAVKIGTINFTAPFTQASLPGIAAGGALISLTIANIGAAAITVTGTDGNANSIAAGASVTWSVADAQGALSTFSANATGSTARVTYSYR